MILEEIYNTENAAQLNYDYKKVRLFSLLVSAKHCITREDRISAFKTLEEAVKVYNEKNNVRAVDV